MELVINSAARFELLANQWLRRMTRDNYFLVSTLKGFRNGIVYGTRIRAPHAFVMVMLFGRGTFLERLKVIGQMTRLHAWNLGRFVLGYKLLMGLLRHNFAPLLFARLRQSDETGNAEGGLYRPWHPFVAAFTVGYFVFGKENGVNTQINLYLLSRIIYGLVKLAVKRGMIRRPGFAVFSWFAALLWGIVLWLFENDAQVLQQSLRSSMTYLYHDSNYWTNARNFILGVE